MKRYCKFVCACPSLKKIFFGVTRAETKEEQTCMLVAGKQTSARNKIFYLFGKNTNLQFMIIIDLYISYQYKCRWLKYKILLRQPENDDNILTFAGNPTLKVLFTVQLCILLYHRKLVTCCCIGFIGMLDPIIISYKLRVNYFYLRIQYPVKYYLQYGV